jgi:hypothetical protein
LAVPQPIPVDVPVTTTLRIGHPPKVTLID